MALTTTIRAQGAAFTPSTLFSTLDNLLASPSSQASIAPGVISIATGTPTVITGCTATITVVTGQIILCGWYVTWSIGSTDSFYCGLYENGVQVSNAYNQLTISTNRTATSGLEDYLGGSHVITAPATGSVTYDLRAWRVGGAGTFYSNNRHFYAVALRGS